MNQQQQYRVRGALFENENPNGPAFRGFIEIDGVKTQITLWPRTSNKGQNYLAVSEDKPKPDAPRPKSPFGRQQPQQDRFPKSNMDDDEFPFDRDR